MAYGSQTLAPKYDMYARSPTSVIWAVDQIFFLESLRRVQTTRFESRLSKSRPGFVQYDSYFPQGYPGYTPFWSSMYYFKTYIIYIYISLYTIYYIYIYIFVPVRQGNSRWSLCSQGVLNEDPQVGWSRSDFWTVLVACFPRGTFEDHCRRSRWTICRFV